VVHPVGEILISLADLADKQGDPRQARQLADRAVAASRRIGDSWQLLGTLGSRRWICLGAGDLTQAAVDVNESAELALRVGDEYGAVETLAAAAEVLFALGEQQSGSSAIRSLSRWLLTNTNDPGHVAATVARHEASSMPGLPEAVANPVRVELRA